jgi:hypothetical protein
MQNIIIQRYHLAALSLIVAAASLIAANISSYYWVYFGRAGLLLLVIAGVPYAPWKSLTRSNSNIDMVAQRVEKEARPNDLIVVPARLVNY